MTVLHAWSNKSRKKLKGDGYCYIIKPYRNVCVCLNENRCYFHKKLKPKIRLLKRMSV